MRTEDWIALNSERLTQISRDIWEHPQTALDETYASGLLAGELEKNGFKITRGLGGMDTAFSASWGCGQPVIAFMGEYDALSGLSQKSLTYKEPVLEGAPGHACGHNLLGTAPLGAVLALKQRMKELDIPGTIVYYGCPAEETMTGKIRMAAAGCFDGVDAALAWHPWPFNVVFSQQFLAMDSARFIFHGTASHASGAPQLGRSALDAAELMNVGVNYLREHIDSDVRIHYSIIDGGGEPNMVPARAASWYYVRAPKRRQVDDVFERVCDVARGAALMTGTTVEIELQTGCWHMLQNDTLNELLQQCLKSVEFPDWTAEEEGFAAALMGKAGVLSKGVLPIPSRQTVIFNSSDTQDVSWITPVAQFGAATAPIGAACHTWQFCSSAGMSIGQKGMIYASKVLAMAGERLLCDKELLAKAAAEFKREKGDTEYRAVVPVRL